MIGAVREWLTSIVVVTLLLSVAQTLIPEGSIRKIAAFTGGLILLAALLQPVLGTDLERLRLDFGDYERAVAQRQAELEVAGKEALVELIEERTAAYISDKADALGLRVEARVETETGDDGVPVPVSVRLDGPRSEELASYIEGELGIPRERQVWHE
ncbi:MAG: stage III sporulation protein AF [Oscillospiraceae bacterium]|nr:stage III sporulation protein AF [Oscillospiraceae bacterium]